MACSCWADELSGVFDQLMEAASGSVDQKIWSSMYKPQHMSCNTGKKRVESSSDFTEDF